MHVQQLAIKQSNVQEEPVSWYEEEVARLKLYAEM
jgi:hypothetical protein